MIRTQFKNEILHTHTINKLNKSDTKIIQKKK